MPNKSLAFLHTSLVHIETFGYIIKELDVKFNVVHEVNESLLNRAIEFGLDSDLQRDIKTQMRQLAVDGAAVVVCTCSTIGEVAEQSADTHLSFQAMRIDRAMADKAVLSADRILVVAALKSTLQPTVQLLESSALNAGREVQLSTVTVESAWQLFGAGEIDNYHRCIARTINSQYHDYDIIVLAQASMAGAIKYCDQIPASILASPLLGVLAAIEKMQT
ncbi:MAG: hypothetical protein MJK10_03490 [Pseudomonadales bacterium]|nr:hypothetical protein [Pseudomonadales bacterium]NRA15133.1 Asp/Glu/hydantoin racemase [Oceanospirillaceae bacterium]